MKRWIPYGRQAIDEADIAAVVEVLRSDYLTTGPKVAEFEARVAAYCGVGHGIAVSNGTAALHCCMHALGIGPGDEVIVPPVTFAATANSVLFQGGVPVFADVDPRTLLLDPQAVEACITPRTRAVIGVDYAGQPCDWDALRAIADRAGVALVADGCHALGAAYKGCRVGSLADMTVFSFHPVKHVATGEGGMVVTDNHAFAERARLFRAHGISSDARSREAAGAWFYEMEELGYNYRLTDIQCALGISQMGKLGEFLRRRREIAHRYDDGFAGTDVAPLSVREDVEHAYHLYVVRVPDRDTAFDSLRGQGVGVNVHYIPVHLHPYYKTRLGLGPGLCPQAEAAYESILSLPMFPAMTDEEIDYVIRATLKAVGS
jgi:perosamine synthetase